MKTSPVLTTRQEREKVLRGGKSGGWERDVIPYNPLLPPQWGAGSVPPSCSALPYEVCFEISKRSQQGGDGTCLREMWLWAEDKWGQQLKTCRRWPGASRETPKITDCAEIHSNKFTRVLFLWLFSSFHPVNYSFSGRVRDVNTGQILQKYTPVCADVRKLSSSTLFWRWCQLTGWEKETRWQWEETSDWD